jgi:hypothetical protein
MGYCKNCGAPLKKENQYCTNCGKLVEQVSKEVHNLPVLDKNISKKESKYLLTPPQRKIFLQKVLPILLIASVIWLISEIFFSYIFIEIEFTYMFLAIYIFIAVVEVNLFIILYFVSKADKPYLGLTIFFSFCFIAGILTLPIMLFTEFLPQVHMFVTLSLGAIIIVCLVGGVLREKYFAKGYLWAHILLPLIGIAILEFAFILIFNIQNFLLTVPVTLGYILIVSLIIMFYGAKAVQKDEKDPWIFILVKIEGVLLLSLVAAIVTVVIVIIIIILAVICGDTNIDLSGIGGAGSRTKIKRKKKE